MVMKVLAALLFLLTGSGLFSQAGLSDVLAGLPQGKATRLTQAQIGRLLTVAAQNAWNVFDLLDETGLYLKAAGKRAVLSGDDLRAAAKPFALGGRRVDTLFPLALVDSLAVGARLDTDAEIAIQLSRPFSAFLELGDFDLQTAYGFHEVGDRELGSAYGVTVKNGLLHWTLQKVARVPDPTGKGSPNFIAIHLDNFFKPKRWKIEPITVRPTTKP
jgi:hypothetical protein